MKKIEIATGVVHEVPKDLEEVLASNSDLLSKWNKLTPLARNEWICWITIVKTIETRKEHIERLKEEILDGKKDLVAGLVVLTVGKVQKSGSMISRNKII